MADIDVRKYGESVVVYEEVLSGEPWPDGFWSPMTSSRRVTEILRYLFLDKLKIEQYEVAKELLTADFIDEYELSILVDKAERPPEMNDGEFFYLLWNVFPEERPSDDELIIKVYTEVLSGRRKGFPRGYFLKNSQVEHRAVVCFRYLCEEVLKLDSEGICETFTMTYSIKILSKYKLKMLVDIVFDSLFHLMSAAYPELAGNLESYRVDKRRAENKGGKKSAD